MGNRWRSHRRSLPTSQRVCGEILFSVTKTPVMTCAPHRPARSRRKSVPEDHGAAKARRARMPLNELRAMVRRCAGVTSGRHRCCRTQTKARGSHAERRASNLRAVDARLMRANPRCWRVGPGRCHRPLHGLLPCRRQRSCPQGDQSGFLSLYPSGSTFSLTSEPVFLLRDRLR